MLVIVCSTPKRAPVRLRALSMLPRAISAAGKSTRMAPRLQLTAPHLPRSLLVVSAGGAAAGRSRGSRRRRHMRAQQAAGAAVVGFVGALRARPRTLARQPQPRRSHSQPHRRLQKGSGVQRGIWLDAVRARGTGTRRRLHFRCPHKPAVGVAPVNEHRLCLVRPWNHATLDPTVRTDAASADLARSVL